MRVKLALLAFLAPALARAFCGFYVAGADSKLWSDATQVVLVRVGTKTVLSMQNDYKGPPQDFALVVPVPVVLQKDNVKTLSPEVFARVDQLSAPRLVEYWEQDPCAPAEGIGLGNIGTIGHGAGGTGQGFGGGGGVKVEAQFEVGEYEVVILSAQDSSGLDAWLRANHYKIPHNAEPAPKPYVSAGSKFFVAKVNVAKVKFDAAGRASLSPLRFQYDSDKLELPVKLGLLNSAGTQDLIVHIIAPDRYEVANYPTVAIPTNLEVNDSARDKFGAFYAALFDKTLAENKGAVVAEYAWGATSCDPCPSSVYGVSPQDLASLGGDVAGITTVTSSGTRIGGVTVTGKLPPEVVQRIVRQNFSRFKRCYDDGLRKNSSLSGKVTTAFEINKDGAIENVRDAGSDLPSAEVVGCVIGGMKTMSFPSPEDGKPVQVVFPIQFTPGNGGGVGMVGSQQLVLTRLHARYTRDALASDLVFRVAPPIAGGREVWKDGKLETGATNVEFGAGNNFQARYAIRHPWTGPVTCASPKRGVWGPKPGGEAPAVRSATKLAYAARDVALASFLGPVSAAPAPPPVADAGAAPPPPPPARCGCNASGAPLALATAAILLARRRRRRP